MKHLFFDRVIKVLCGVSAAFLAIPFFMTPVTVNADAYSGITIDGDFSDWDGVIKYDVPSYYDNVTMNQAAIVWDGDWIYIYLDEAQQNSASWSGPYGDGNFNIVTDIGEVLMISVHNNGEEGNIVEVTNPLQDLYLSNTNGDRNPFICFAAVFFNNQLRILSGCELC